MVLSIVSAGKQLGEVAAAAVTGFDAALASYVAVAVGGASPSADEQQRFLYTWAIMAGYVYVAEQVDKTRTS